MRNYNRLDAYLIIAGGLSPHDLEAQETLDQMVHSIRVQEAQLHGLVAFVEAVRHCVEGSASVEGKLTQVRAELGELESRLCLRVTELPVTTILRTRTARAEKDGDR